MTDIVFVDCETTGLDPQRDAILEIALIKDNEETVWWIELTGGELGRANSIALKVNHYYDRTGNERFEGYNGKDWLHHWVKQDKRTETALQIAKTTAGCVLAGNTVKFDQQFLETWLRRHGACPVWDYHVLDVPTFAAGVIKARLGDPRFLEGNIDEEVIVDMEEAIKPPFKSSKVSKALNIPEPEGEEAHTALADARWAKQMWEAVS